MNVVERVLNKALLGKTHSDIIVYVWKLDEISMVITTNECLNNP